MLLNSNNLQLWLPWLIGLRLDESRTVWKVIIGWPKGTVARRTPTRQGNGTWPHCRIRRITGAAVECKTRCVSRWARVAAQPPRKVRRFKGATAGWKAGSVVSRWAQNWAWPPRKVCLHDGWIPGRQRPATWPPVWVFLKKDPIKFHKSFLRLLKCTEKMIGYFIVSRYLLAGYLFCVNK